MKRAMDVAKATTFNAAHFVSPDERVAVDKALHDISTRAARAME
jgi:hypothetical protein